MAATTTRRKGSSSSRYRDQLSLSLYAFTDEEFLSKVGSEGDEEGWVSTPELAQAIFKTNSVDANRCVGARLAWMRKFGTVERDTENGSPTKDCWRLSEMGYLLVTARLSAASQRSLQTLSETELWQASLLIAASYQRSGDTTASMVRRTFQAATYRRKVDR